MGRIAQQISTGKPLQWCSSSHAQTLKDNALADWEIPNNDVDVLENKTSEEYFTMLDEFIPLLDYKAKVKESLKKAGKVHAYAIWTAEDQLNVNGGIESGNTTKARKDTFIAAMKTEWGVVKQALIDAADKGEVDAVTPNFPVAPTP
jgi:hypothetical protein|tara:strand:- start:16 stop:456 length:441 start_codon:yes stop_codon:yes gene_type:complete